jgi:hypothetical protein
MKSAAKNFSTMTPDEFRAAAVAGDEVDGSPLLRALWHDARGEWNRAHQIAQDMDSADAAWLHAYLHRREGDLGNARYWYRRAGRPEATDTLDAEWIRLAEQFLGR